jgi:predicted cupin superfamily sugar epimerase
MIEQPARDSRYWIEKLRLEPHPEGGYFRQTYRAELVIPREVLPGFGGARAASTAIYFLLEGKNFSAFHRLRSDEMWHFYAGSPLLVHGIDPAGRYYSILLGDDLEAGQVFQAVVRAGCWFGAEVTQNPHFSQNRGEVGHPSYATHFPQLPWALVGCTVAPGFEFEDFEMARREELIGRFPQHVDLIRKLTRE